MNEHELSDSLVAPQKPPNKAEEPADMAPNPSWYPLVRFGVTT